jgi:uridine kinase
MDLVARLADAVVDLRPRHDRLLVGIDGPDAAGKTTLADRLAADLPGPVLRVSVDDFVTPREERYRRGELSPEGFYRDLVDVAAFVDACLAGNGATVVAEGIFLLRPELRDLWTLSVYLRVSEEESLRRALERDVGLFGSAEEVERRYRARYLPGQALYRGDTDPERRADVLVDNEDVAEMPPPVRRRPLVDVCVSGGSGGAPSADRAPRRPRPRRPWR